MTNTCINPVNFKPAEQLNDWFYPVSKQHHPHALPTPPQNYYPF